MQTTSLEIVLLAIVGALFVLSFWFDVRRRKADRQNAQRVRELQLQIDRLNANIDALQRDLRLLYPSVEVHKN